MTNSKKNYFKMIILNPEVLIPQTKYKNMG